MYLLLFLFVVVKSDIVDVIRDNLHDYTQFTTAASMCGITSERLFKHGIQLHSVSECISSPIDSEYGSTLLELYQNFERLDSRFLKSAEEDSFVARLAVSEYCNFEMMFKRGLVVWSQYNAPPLPISHCFHIKSFTGNCTVLEPSGKLYGDFILESFDQCLAALEDISMKRWAVRALYVESLTLPTLLNMEISKVWRYQMPERLKSISSWIMLRP